MGGEGCLVNLGMNWACPAGGFSMWTGLQGTEDVMAAISESNAYMAALDGCNDQADHTVWSASVVLWVLVGPLKMQRELCMCCYLLHHLLGPQCLLVKALRSQVVEVVNKGLS